MLTLEIANSIVKETALRLNRNVNIMDNQGIIIASCDNERLDDIHEGALEVLKNGLTLKITTDHKEVWKGAHPGINLPIIFQGENLGVIGITGNPDEMADLGEIVKMTTELLIKQEYINSQLEWKHRTKEMIIEELIKAQPRYDHIERGLNLLNTQLKPHFSTLVIQMSDRLVPNKTIIGKLEEIIGEREGILGFININRIFIATSGLSQKIITRKADEISNILKMFKVHFRIAISTPFETLENFNHSYTDCDLALAISDQKEELIYYADIESKALIYQLNNDVAERFSKRMLSETLLKYKYTLEVFFIHNFNIQQAAEALFIHRNTLIYRLNKIKEDTGYNPKNFKDAVTLQLAIWGSEKLKSESFHTNNFF